MSSSPKQLREHAIAIWRAGVDAVDSEKLVRQHVGIDAGKLAIGETVIELSSVNRIAVVGAGKAGAGMAAGIEAAIPELLHRTVGWVNVPDDCVRSLSAITLHGARPAGLNEPTQAGVDGTQQILSMLGSLEPNDVCVVLISGGGSALLPAPCEGISLADKLAVTRLLMSGGVPIDELNCVRRHLSELKGGGLVSHTKAGHVVALVISDVVGDPLNVIASGPTVFDPSTREDALSILEPFADRVPASVLERLSTAEQSAPVDFARVSNFIVGNNEVAIDASAKRARELGYSVVVNGSDVTGIARDVGRDLAAQAKQLRDGESVVPTCILSGGEPTVNLAAAEVRGVGGRNQEAALAALIELADDGRSIAVLSGGTDGEDGPTDAAGGVITEDTIAATVVQGLPPLEFLERSNAYPFLEATGGLLKTGPTHTNVMDVRVALVGS